MTLTLYTYDWLPEFPRGFVRDMRVRWILEELGRDYQVKTVPTQPKSDAHRAMQPFAQVPVIQDEGMTLFESGAIMMHLAEGTALLPKARKAEVAQWVFAALNTIEVAGSHWINLVLAERMPEVFGPVPAPAVIAHAREGLATRLAALENVVSKKEWLAGEFSVGDLAMIDVLRVLDAEGMLTECPELGAFVRRGTGRPAFKRAMADHMAHWTAADEARAVASPA